MWHVCLSVLCSNMRFVLREVSRRHLVPLHAIPRHGAVSGVHLLPGVAWGRTPVVNGEEVAWGLRLCRLKWPVWGAMPHLLHLVASHLRQRIPEQNLLAIRAWLAISWSREKTVDVIEVNGFELRGKQLWKKQGVKLIGYWYYLCEHFTELRWWTSSGQAEEQTVNQTEEHSWNIIQNECRYYK